MSEPEFVEIIDGWAAVGEGWAVFGTSREQARQRFEEADRRHHDIGARPGIPWRTPDAPDVWSEELPPGGYVCGDCGQPVESEPCGEHQPRRYFGSPA